MTVCRERTPQADPPTAAATLQRAASASIGDVVATVLDRQRNKVTVRDVPDGTLPR
ncbi:hypothetical protein [Streptomyces sp. NPDC101178]|uniref:hypothetical protein n=1 Tax=Streptomyces sp. NPDC101178 TaxID=3366124 RepID=UPI0037FF0B8E